MPFLLLLPHWVRLPHRLPTGSGPATTGLARRIAASSSRAEPSTWQISGRSPSCADLTYVSFPSSPSPSFPPGTLFHSISHAHLAPLFFLFTSPLSQEPPPPPNASSSPPRATPAPISFARRMQPSQHRRPPPLRDHSPDAAPCSTFLLFRTPPLPSSQAVWAF